MHGSTSSCKTKYLPVIDTDTAGRGIAGIDYRVLGIGAHDYIIHHIIASSCKIRPVSGVCIPSNK